MTSYGKSMPLPKSMFSDSGDGGSTDTSSSKEGPHSGDVMVGSSSSSLSLPNNSFDENYTPTLLEMEEDVVTPPTSDQPYYIENTTPKSPWWRGNQLVILLGVTFLVSVLISSGALFMHINNANGINHPSFAAAQQMQRGENETLPDTNEAASSSTLLPIQITYDIANDCGFDSHAVMNEVDNTLKSGLIHATTQVTLSILKEKYYYLQRPQIQVQTHSIRKVNIFTQKQDEDEDYDGDEDEVSLAKPTMIETAPELHSVTIDRIIDIREECDENENCLLILSTVTIDLLEEDDGEVEEVVDRKEEVTKAIVHDISSSFQDGSFYEAIPEDAVACP